MNNYKISGGMPLDIAFKTAELMVWVIVGI